VECPKYHRWNFQEVFNYIKSFGYELLSTEYKGINTRIKIKCPQGHITEKSFNGFLSGYRCLKCCGSEKHSYEYIEKKFIENDLTMRMGTWNGTLTMGFGMQIIPNFRFDYGYYAGDLVKEHYVGGHYTFD